MLKNQQESIIKMKVTILSISFADKDFVQILILITTPMPPSNIHYLEFKLIFFEQIVFPFITEF